MSKFCYNCGNKANTKDHCPPRFIYKDPLPKNIKTVPSCQSCNNGVSKDESIFFGYLCAMMGPKNYLYYSKRALKSNKKLRNEIFGKILNKNHALIPKDAINKIIIKIIKGLFYLKYNKKCPPVHFEISITQNNLGQNIESLEMIKHLPRNIIQEDVFDFTEDFAENGEGKVIINFLNELFIAGLMEVK